MFSFFIISKVQMVQIENSAYGGLKPYNYI